MSYFVCLFVCVLVCIFHVSPFVLVERDCYCLLLYATALTVCVFFSEYSFLFKSQLRRSIFIRTISTVIRWSTQDPNRRKQVNVLFVCCRISSETSRPPSNDHLGPKTIERRREIVLCVVLYSQTNVRHRAHQLRVKTTYVQHFRERAPSKTTTVHGYLSLQYSVFRINIRNKKPPNKYL